MVSVDIDPIENADQLARFGDKYGFTWRLAIGSREMLAEFQNAFGTQFLTPPAEPMFIVDPKGTAHLAPFGHRDAATIRALVAKYRAA